MPLKQTIKVALAVAVLLLVALVSGAAGFAAGYLAGYDDGFYKMNADRLRDAQNAKPIDWTTPENQKALRKAFPDAFREPGQAAPQE